MAPASIQGLGSGGVNISSGCSLEVIGRGSAICLAWI